MGGFVSRHIRRVALTWGRCCVLPHIALRSPISYDTGDLCSVALQYIHASNAASIHLPPGQVL